MDVLRKYLIDSEDLQLAVLDATELVSESMHRTGAWPPATIHLGQGLMSTALLLSVLTKETAGKLSLQWSSNGPFGDLYVEGQPSGEFRGTIMRPQSPVQNLKAGMGPGQLQVRKAFLTSSQGIIRSQGYVCTDVLHYLEQSEQRQCAMNLWVDLSWDDNDQENPVVLKKALGYLLEVLPTSNRSQDKLRGMTWEHRIEELDSLSNWGLNDQDPLGSMVDRLTEGLDANEILTQRVKFSCKCSEERAERALTLAIAQSGDPRAEEESIRCEFCGKTYTL